MREGFSKIELKSNYEEGMEAVRSYLERGEYPVVTVPRQYADSLRFGLRPGATWIPGENIIAGTIGREPYKPEGEERVAVRVKVDSPDQLEPRLTGPDRAFHGVVAFKGPVTASQIEIIQ